MHLYSTCSFVVVNTVVWYIVMKCYKVTKDTVKGKGNWSRYRPGVAQRVGRGIALLFHDRGTRRGWVVSSTLRPHFTPGKVLVPIYRRLVGPQGRPGRAENLVPIGIRSQTVQPVVSRYTDWATGPTSYKIWVLKFPKGQFPAMCR